MEKQISCPEIPARIIWELANKPKELTKNKSLEDSLIENGWQENHPAKMFLRSGYVPILRDGKHRLSALHALNKLDMKIPVLVYLPD